MIRLVGYTSVTCFALQGFPFCFEDFLCICYEKNVRKVQNLERGSFARSVEGLFKLFHVVLYALSFIADTTTFYAWFNIVLRIFVITIHCGTNTLILRALLIEILSFFSIHRSGHIEARKLHCNFRNYRQRQGRTSDDLDATEYRHNCCQR